MANTLISLNQPALTGATLYVKVENSAGQVCNGIGSLVTYTLANLATYCFGSTSTPSFAESPAGSGRWSLNFATLALPADTYTWTICKRVGGTPAISDPVVADGGDYWNGAVFGTVPATPTGTGSRTVNQDYPTTGNLAFKTAGGQGIGGALVLAYLASEYAASPNTALIRGQTTTLDSGGWASNMLLDPGSYAITFAAAGYALAVVNQTVS